MKRLADLKISDAELREQYQRTGLPALGIPYHVGIDIPGVRITLTGAVEAKRRVMARKAAAAPIQHQVREVA